jgi:LacI family transcriptional regulator
MTTITDIAQALNISTATVSRALNQSRLITPELTAKVSKTAEKMGYVKRNIRRPHGRSILNIKLVLPQLVEPERALFFDFTALISGIKAGFTKCEINLICDSNAPDFKLYPHKKGGDINGFIFAFHAPSAAHLKELKKYGTPFMVLNRDIPELPCVATENAVGMEQIVNHLLKKRSALKPAFVSLEDLGQIHERRLNGLINTCKNHKLAFDPNKDVFVFPNIHSIITQKVKSLSKPYNALICVNDIVGTVVLSELERLGIGVPTQIAVTGFDDSPVRQLSRPLLTTVSLPVAKLAECGAARLESQIVDLITTTNVLKVPGELMLGQST